MPTNSLIILAALKLTRTDSFISRQETLVCVWPSWQSKVTCRDMNDPNFKLQSHKQSKQKTWIYHSLTILSHMNHYWPANRTISVYCCPNQIPVEKLLLACTEACHPVDLLFCYPLVDHPVVQGLTLCYHCVNNTSEWLPSGNLT